MTWIQTHDGNPWRGLLGVAAASFLVAEDVA